MKEAVIKERLLELIDITCAISLSTQLKGSKPDGIIQPISPRAKSTDTDETLNHLRLHVKYLLFDLEASKRENQYLRQMLENRSKRNSEGEAGDGPPRR